MKNKSAKKLITVENLSWIVDGKSILKEINFSVQQQEFVGIIGPNGAGKSSLLKCFYGVNTPTSGNVFIEQQALTHFSRRLLAQKIAVVLQEPPHQFELTVKDVIRMGLTPHKALLSFDSEIDEQEILKASKQVDINHKLEQRFNSLSGGEKQRAIIARAIVQKPSILIMDEPTNHLDIKHQFEVLDFARSMNITVIVSLHDLNLAANFCDRLLLMNDGEIVAEGEPKNVLTQENLQRVFKVHSIIDAHPFSQKPRITYNAMSDKNV